MRNSVTHTVVHTATHRPVRRPAMQKGVATARANRRGGLTLFEVVLSIAIFMMAMAAIGELIRSGSRASVQAKLKTEASIRCETKLAEVVGGVTPFQPANGTFSDEEWTWELKIEDTDMERLKLVTMTVGRSVAGGETEVEFSIKRLLRDPAVFEEAAMEEILKAEEDAANAEAAGASP